MGRVVIINSSGRARSNSSALGRAVAGGAREKGHKPEVLDLGRPGTGAPIRRGPRLRKNYRSILAR